MVFLIFILTFVNPNDVSYTNRYFSPLFGSFTGASLCIGDSSFFWISTLREKSFYGLSFKKYCEFCNDSAINPLGFYFGKVYKNRFFGASCDFGFFSRESSYYGDLLSGDKHNFFMPQFYLSWTSSKNINLLKVSFPLYRLNYITLTDTFRVFASHYKFSYITKYDFTPQWFWQAEIFLGKSINKTSNRTIQHFSNFDSTNSVFVVGGEFRLFYNPFGHTYLSPGLLLSSYGDSVNLNLLFCGFYEISRFLGLISDLKFEMNSKSIFLSSMELRVRKMYWSAAALGLRISKEFLSLDFLFDPFKKTFLSSTLQIRFAK